MGLVETLNEVEAAYFMDENIEGRDMPERASSRWLKWCFQVSDIPYSILTIDCANTPSNKLAEKYGFELFEKRTPNGHKRPAMESDSYFY